MISAYTVRFGQIEKVEDVKRSGRGFTGMMPILKLDKDRKGHFLMERKVIKPYFSTKEEATASLLANAEAELASLQVKATNIASQIKSVKEYLRNLKKL